MNLGHTYESLKATLGPVEIKHLEDLLQAIDKSRAAGIELHQLKLEMAGKTVEFIHQEAHREEELVRRVADARKALDLASGDYKASWLVWLELSKNVLNEYRQWRMAMDQECRLSLAAFGDVRKFFLDPQHPEEVKRLKEFVELCERLKALKDCGFLDTVADTILKLAPPK